MLQEEKIQMVKNLKKDHQMYRHQLKKQALMVKNLKKDHWKCRIQLKKSDQVKNQWNQKIWYQQIYIMKKTHQIPSENLYHSRTMEYWILKRETKLE